MDQEFVTYIEGQMKAVQDDITSFLERVSGQKCREDLWTFEKGSGGGRSRVWESSSPAHMAGIEKGGVNFSLVRGDSLPESAATAFKLPPGTPYLATGVSLVIHPRNPFVPTIHMNIRYFAAQPRNGEPLWWFGGGVDLTPYYPSAVDVMGFHESLLKLCGDFGEDYVRHKAACDEYFTNRHRKEMRGVSGIFFDHMNTKSRDEHAAFVVALGLHFKELYGPFWRTYPQLPFGEAQREFQLLRRGRYVEFNLVWDRGTKFGIMSDGRTESILMSLPTIAKWKYDWQPAPGSIEAAITSWYYQPQDWIGHELAKTPETRERWTKERVLQLWPQLASSSSSSSSSSASSSSTTTATAAPTVAASSSSCPAMMMASGKTSEECGKCCMGSSSGCPVTRWAVPVLTFAVGMAVGAKLLR